LREQRRLRVFENRRLRKISGPKTDEVKGGAKEAYIARGFMLCIPHQILFVLSNQKE
jgi:hypothetical protein